MWQYGSPILKSACRVGASILCAAIASLAFIAPASGKPAFTEFDPSESTYTYPTSISAGAITGYYIDAGAITGSYDDSGGVVDGYLRSR